MAIPERSITLEQFLKLPEEKPALEYEGGTVTQKVSPRGPHGRLQFWLARLVDSPDISARRAAAFTETRITFGGNSFVPDLIVYRWERIPREANGRIAENFATPPDLAVEILSPGQSVREQERRCRWYVDNGVRMALFINPRTESITLFQPDREPVLLAGDDLIDLDPVLPGLRLTVREVFAAIWPGP